MAVYTALMVCYGTPTVFLTTITKDHSLLPMLKIKTPKNPNLLPRYTALCNRELKYTTKRDGADCVVVPDEPVLLMPTLDQSGDCSGEYSGEYSFEERQSSVRSSVLHNYIIKMLTFLGCWADPE